MESSGNANTNIRKCDGRPARPKPGSVPEPDDPPEVPNPQSPRKPFPGPRPPPQPEWSLEKRDVKEAPNKTDDAVVDATRDRSERKKN